MTVEETIIEVSKKHSPTGERYVAKPYPKDNEPRTFGVDEDWLEAAAQHIKTHGIGRDQLLFTTSTGTPISRNTFRTRVWQPAVKASGVDFAVRMHDLRHAHASWLLAEGSDLKSVMERMGHAQIQTTQKYLHALPEADQKNLDALARARQRRQQPRLKNRQPASSHQGDQACTTRRRSTDPGDPPRARGRPPITRLVEAWNHELVTPIRRRGRQAEKRLGDRQTDAHQALPQGQRTPHHGTPTRAGHPARHTSPSGVSSPKTCSSPPETSPPCRDTFRTRIWLPAVQASGVDFEVRVHDLRHAHASWLLAGGSDLKAVMDRMGHAQITTTQKYLHPMPDADTKNLTALDRIRNPEQPDRGEPSRGGPDAGSDQEPTS